LDDAPRAWEALRAAGLRPQKPLGTEDEPEPLVVFVDPRSNVDVDLLVAAGDPEASAIDRASSTAVFGVQARVATLEDLLLLYLYSNQPKHIGDFAAIVQSGLADLGRAEKALAEMHAEMLPDWQQRVREAKQPPPAPQRPPRRPRRPRRP